MNTDAVERRILFFAETDGNAELCRSIATSLHEMRPDLECALVDVSDNYPHCVSGDYVFREAGFRTLKVKAESCSPGAFLDRFTGLFSAEMPCVIVVPHELGYAGVAIALGAAAGIPSYQYQHGDYSPDYFLTPPPARPKVWKTAEPSGRHGLQWFSSEQLQLARQEYRLIRRLAGSAGRRLLEGRSASRRLRRGRSATTPPAVWAHPALAEGYTFTTDRIGVNGEYYRRRLLEFGFPADRIAVVGNLRTDQFKRQEVETYPQVCEAYHLEPSRPLAAYFFSPIEDGGEYSLALDPIDAIRDAIDCLQRVEPRFNVLLVNHPRSPMSALDRIVKDTGRLVAVGYAGDHFAALCRHASLIMGVQSAALTEAALFGRPMLTQNYVLRFGMINLLTEYGAVAPVFHRNDLGDQMERIIHDRAFAERVSANQAIAARELHGPMDGRCGERSARSILEMLGARCQ